MLLGDCGVEIDPLSGLPHSYSAPKAGFVTFWSVWKGGGIWKMARGGSSEVLDSCKKGAPGNVVVGGEVELSLVVLLGQKLNLGGLSNGLEPLEFGVLGFNVAKELLGSEAGVSGVGSPNVPTVANGFGLDDGVPNMVGGGTTGWALGSRPAVFFVESSFGLEV